MNDATETGSLPWGLVAWILVACVGFMWAPAPPPVPPPGEEELAARARATALVVRDVQRWQAEHGDLRIPWDEAEGHLAIVIDDVGRELHLFDQLLSLRFPLTFSVLPGGIYAAGVQLRLRADRRRPREIMLHLPMEPVEAEEMTRGAEAREVFLRSSDTPEQLRDKLVEALRRVPAAVGVNNHMGSQLSADRTAMDAIMPVLRERGMWFLDSRTTAETVAEQAARDAGVPRVARHVFLDHARSRAAIEASLHEAMRMSREGPTVAIGHPSVELVEVLSRELPRLHAEGIGIYPLSRLVAASDRR